MTKNTEKQKLIVVSAVNIVSGGTLTILNDALSALSDYIASNDKYKAIAYVHQKNTFNYPNIEYREVPKAKNSWLRRVYTEYFYFKKESKSLDVDVWLSLHDTSPSVKARLRAVYCHNPMAFYNLSLNDLRFDYKIILFTLFYKFLYRINIKKNDYVIVQQNWLRDKFKELYKIEKHKLAVFYPSNSELIVENSCRTTKKHQVQFFYPSLSRQFKNFEVICRAVELLNEREIFDFKVLLTIDGSENKYGNWVVNKYKHLKNIDFCGLIPYSQMKDYYCASDCLIFPSKIETWGLPISEFAAYNKPIIAADLPYAHETASNANKVCMFNPDSAEQLAELMSVVIDGSLDKFRPAERIKIEEPNITSWKHLFFTFDNHKKLCQ